MPVACLGKFLFNDVTDKQNFASAQQRGNNECGECRYEYHGDSADNTGYTKRQCNPHKCIKAIGTKIPSRIDDVGINLGKGIVNRQHHKWQKVIYHTKDNGRGCINDI